MPTSKLIHYWSVCISQAQVLTGETLMKKSLIVPLLISCVALSGCISWPGKQGRPHDPIETKGGIVPEKAGGCPLLSISDQSEVGAFIIRTTENGCLSASQSPPRDVSEVRRPVVPEMAEEDPSAPVSSVEEGNRPSCQNTSYNQCPTPNVGAKMRSKPFNPYLAPQVKPREKG